MVPLGLLVNGAQGEIAEILNNEDRGPLPIEMGECSIAVGRGKAMKILVRRKVL